ncbi:hypothetical protein OB2597_07560 [Pseudooceanicola batsensis HTCC2597]|uniref:Aspartate carbamoyltransferase catalytic subunit n=1 Tax=Pseudooceanicola batsensis (strain ATCC BAA-863 / DSM 15984 / KCTC 12145 / HTCC2597) TaxID=252305 RepID=A3TTZ7_PSEBH|nr:hypothetical protein [Pseudooceanicola batsensis]EAQ05124.1 hypothetical protein OB2597_07560 [Pseudooceanicola batsensis HTCC2597]
MTETLLSGDRDTVHLFSVALPEDQLWTFVTSDPDTGRLPLREALGVETLDETQIEGAVAEDLEGIGLSGFLIEGIGVDEAAIARDRARIDAVSGSVVIVKGSAFDGAHVPLEPQPPLAHVGTWRLTAAPSTMEQLSSPTAEGRTEPAPAATPEVRGKRNRWSLWLLIGMGLVILAGLVFGLLA